MDVNIYSVIVCVSVFSRSFSVRMYYCTALSAVLDWICALQVFIIVIIIIIITCARDHALLFSVSDCPSVSFSVITRSKFPPRGCI